MANYTKSLRPFRKLFLPSFVIKRYPEFEKFVDCFLKYLDEKNPLEFWDEGSSDESANSFYKNVAHLNERYYIESLPVKNKDLLAMYIRDFARGLDTRNQSLDFDLEVVRKIANDSTIIFRLKGCYSAFNFFIRNIYDSFVGGAPYSQTLLCRFTISSEFEGSITQLPNYAAIPDKQSVLTEIPGYSLEDNILTLGEISVVREVTPADGVKPRREDIIEDDKGRHPFHYQIVSKSDVFKAGNFVRNLLGNFNPAGYHCEIFVQYDDLDCPDFIDCKDFSQYNYEIFCTGGVDYAITNDEFVILTNDDFMLYLNQGDVK